MELGEETGKAGLGEVTEVTDEVGEVTSRDAGR